MNKEYKIKLDLNKKIYNKKMTFNQFDENVNDFYIEVTKNNEVVKDLDKSIVILVTIKPNGTVDAQFIEPKDGQIYADLKPSMCDLVGNYQAKAMIVLGGEIVTTDTINYSVNEDKIISKLNEDTISDERFTLFTDALARLSTIEISEEQRMINEAERILSEENRKIEEANRVEAELVRQHEEADRAKYDAARESNENIRKLNEDLRKSNETTRQNNETQRVSAETQRQSRYNSFIASAESNANNFEGYVKNAKANEEERKSNELDRKAQENSRKANETTRQNNEASRQNAFTNKVNEVNDKISEIDKSKSDMTTSISNKINEVETRFNTLTSKQQQDAEVIDAREGEVSLKARLDKDIENPKKLYNSIEGAEISVDSLEGYLKDVEILGNTVQDQDNLADIRSVGDKLENQELYEIPVLSTGKNLFDGVIYKKDGFYDVTGSWGTTNVLDTFRIKCKPNTQYIKNSYINGIVSFFDSDNSFISGVNTHLQNQGISRLLFTTPDNCYWFCISVDKTKVDNAQIEEGTQATPYEPYKEHKLTILSPIQLEKVGDVADRIICKDGVWGVEKIINTLKITENATWKMNYGTLTAATRINTRQFYTESYDNINLFPGSKAICNKLNYGVPVYNTDVEGIIFVSTTDSRLRIGHTCKSIDEFKEWLRVNDVFVKYSDTQPQFIPLPHDQQVKLRTFANKTNIHFECEIEPTLKASVPKSLGASVSSNTEQIDILHRELDKIKKLLLQSEVVF